MDDKVMALVGAAAGVALAGRGLRPIAKLAMRSAMMAADATAGIGRDLAGLYAEVRAEQRGATPDVERIPTSPPAP